MKDLTEKKLQELGFKKQVVTPEEAGEPEGYHFFTYELFNQECLISQGNDEIDAIFYYVKFLNMPSAGKFWNSHDVRKLIEHINSGEK